MSDDGPRTQTDGFPPALNIQQEVGSTSERITPHPPIIQEAHQAMSALPPYTAMVDLAPLPQALPKAQPPRTKKTLTRSLLLLALLFIVTLTLGGLFLSVKSSSRSVPSSATTPYGTGNSDGQVVFASSALFNREGTAGINDQLQISLDHIVPPAAGKSFYGWLESDKNQSDTNVVSLGKLSFSGKTARLKYQDPQQRNLLASFSQVLITQEPSDRVPIVPSLNKRDWRYTGSIPQTPAPSDLKNHYSLLDHLRHLLADDPTLDQLHLAGGLDVWQYRDVGKLLEWSQSARDSWGIASATAFVHRQVIRTLDYIDGTAYAYVDVPAGMPELVDPLQFRVGLVDVITGETPPSYMTHIGQHLTSMALCPGVTAEQIQRTARIDEAINRVADLLQQVREDAKQLVEMGDHQLLQRHALELLNDMANRASDAYSGSPDMKTGNLQPGSVWIHSQIRLLATFALSPYLSR